MAEREPASALTGASALSRLERSGDENPLQDHPRLRTFFECWLDTFIFNGKVDPRLRELVILRVMWRCGQPFEWGNHYRLARRAGLSDEEILAVRTADPESDLHGEVALGVRAADEVVDLGALSAPTMAALRELMADPGVLQEFLYLVAGYRMMATVSASTRREHRGAQWPPDGIGPPCDQAGS